MSTCSSKKNSRRHCQCKYDRCYYTGNEPSPKGLGYCAHNRNEGDIMKGADGQMWQVKKLSSGSCQRWIKVRVVLSKSKANKSKRTIRSTTCESNDKTKKSIPNCALDGSNKLKRSLSEKCLVKTLMRTSAYNRSSCNGCSKSGCYYTGKEASPKGLGQCAHLLPVGEKRIGRDGYEWEVIKCGTGKRWKQLPDYSSDSESSDYD